MSPNGSWSVIFFDRCEGFKTATTLGNVYVTYILKYRISSTRTLQAAHSSNSQIQMGISENTKSSGSRLSYSYHKYCRDGVQRCSKKYQLLK